MQLLTNTKGKKKNAMAGVEPRSILVNSEQKYASNDLDTTARWQLYVRNWFIAGKFPLMASILCGLNLRNPSGRTRPLGLVSL
jgi:hypothetical protein